ncbi:MAG: PorV/PorQ family protein [Candidatus Krumholzibacteriia bacterium]
MSARRRIVPVLAAALALLAAGTASAADDGGVRSVFARGAGERALGLGGAYGAVAGDATALFWNPAGLARAERVALQASHTDLIGLGFYEQQGALVLPGGRLGTFAFGFRRFGVDGIEGRDDRGTLTADDLTDAESELSVGFGRGLGEALTLGAAFKLQNHELAGASGSGMGLDLGVQGRPLLAAGGTSALARDLCLGMTLRNVIEPTIRLSDEDVPDPMSVRFAAAAGLPLGGATRLLLTADLERTRGMDSRLHAGAELVLLDLLALRTGSNDGVLAAGAGLRWHNLAVDYAFEDNVLEAVHRFGLGIAFGATTRERRQAALDHQQQDLAVRLEDAFQWENAQRNAALIDGARDALDAGDCAAALDRAQMLLVLAPENPAGRTLAARAHLELGREAEAEDDLAGAAIAYERCLKLEPGLTEGREALARVKAASDRLAERSAAIRALYDEGTAHYVSGEYAEARTVLRRALEIDGNDREAYGLLQLTEQALRAEQDITAAMARTDASGRRTEPLPPSRRAQIADLYRKGVVAAESGRRDDAARCWELVWSAAPDYRQVGDFLKQEYLARGMEAFAAGRLDAAVTSWEKALEVDPDDPRALGYLARAHEHLDRLREVRSAD